MKTIVEDPGVSQAVEAASPTQSSQDSTPVDTLPRSDRKLLLAASLGLLLRRMHHGIVVRRGDLLRLVDYADDDIETAA